MQPLIVKLLELVEEKYRSKSDNSVMCYVVEYITYILIYLYLTRQVS